MDWHIYWCEKEWVLCQSAAESYIVKMSERVGSFVFSAAFGSQETAGRTRRASRTLFAGSKCSSVEIIVPIAVSHTHKHPHTASMKR